MLGGHPATQDRPCLCRSYVPVGKTDDQWPGQVALDGHGWREGGQSTGNGAVSVGGKKVAETGMWRREFCGYLGMSVPGPGNSSLGQGPEAGLNLWGALRAGRSHGAEGQSPNRRPWARGQPQREFAERTL